MVAGTFDNGRWAWRARTNTMEDDATTTGREAAGDTHFEYAWKWIL